MFHTRHNKPQIFPDSSFLLNMLPHHRPGLRSAHPRPKAQQSYLLPELLASSTVSVVIPPLWDMARWKSFFARGDITRFMTLWAPADSPVTVTFLGSPPKALMFFFIHSRAWMVSRVPKLPESVSGITVSVVQDGLSHPKGPSRY